MTDRLSTAVDALERLPVSVTWSAVEQRLDRDGSASDDGVTHLPDPGPSRDGVTHGRGSHRRLVAAAVLVLIAGVTAVLTWPVDDGDPVRTGPGPTTSASPDPTPAIPPPTSASTDEVTATTQPAMGTAWGSAVHVWTGSEYLVWSGQVGGDGRGRADGWRFDPATGSTQDIPVAPIAPRDFAAGVWTGTEMIVCCGRSLEQGLPAYDTASAAAYDPTTDAWRALTPPPAAAGGYIVGVAWSGSEMLVVVQLGDPGAATFGDQGLGLYAYDPVTDTWDERAKPTWGDRFGEVVWTGDRLVIWSQRAPGVDGGVVYDPAADRWSWLPELPKDAPVYYGSAAWVDGQLVVWGLDGRDDRSTVGYRLRLGDGAWRRMADAPLPPIERYDGTPGSQTLATDEATGTVIVYPTHGYESGGGAEGVPPPPLLAYDPEADAWTRLGDLGGSPYAPDLIVGGDVVLTPDRADPEVLRLEP